MLGLNKDSLLFPQLAFVQDGVLHKPAQRVFACNPPPTDPKLVKLGKKYNKPVDTPIRLYALDWTHIDQIRLKRAKANYDQHHASLRPWCPPPIIPKSYADAMDRLTFAIPNDYMKAINHMCNQAMQEWEQSYPFDTMVREQCYKSVIGYIDSAFCLLSDCIYDHGEKYYNREYGTAQVFRHMGRLRLWRMQTGLCMAFEYSGIATKFITNSQHHPCAYPEIEAMHNDMHDFLERLTAAYHCDYALPEHQAKSVGITRKKI